MIALLEDEGGVNFVVASWDNFFEALYFWATIKNYCKIRPSESMEDGRTWHITSTHLQEQKYCG